VARGGDFGDARRRAYLALDRIRLAGSHFRTDIAERVVE